MKKPIILGLSASLRNARSLDGARDLVADLQKVSNEDGLYDYLAKQGNSHLEQYMSAGREKGESYDEIYKKLKTMGGRNGLSNSEVCLAAALWGAYSVGAEIEQIPLADFFTADGKIQDLFFLKERLVAADGIILSTPVYFGDRSSLSQRLINLLRVDNDLRGKMVGKVYGGVAVGAKRNGGQETAIIYQLHDMMELGFVGVGNDYETTSQYGGTGYAGDIATMPKDIDGLHTCIGTGRRVARSTCYNLAAKEVSLYGKVKVGVLLLQDSGEYLQKALPPFFSEFSSEASFQVLALTKDQILPCMACDICPSTIGYDEKYRCVRGKNDVMATIHNQLLDFDIIVPVMFSPRDRKNVHSVYQRFLERTRYLRRGDYALSDRLVAPIVISEIGANENLNIRMSTSLIRHHTMLHKSIIGWLHEGQLLNSQDLKDGLKSIVTTGRRLTAGRLAMVGQGTLVAQYKPKGYILSLTKDNLPETLNKREDAVKKRIEKLLKQVNERLVLHN